MESKFSHLLSSTVVALPPNAWLPKLCRIDLLSPATVPALQFYCCLFIHVHPSYTFLPRTAADDPLLFPAL